MTVDTEKLRSLSPSLNRFLEFEREVEGEMQREVDDRRREYDEEKRQREKRARKKRLKRMRALQRQ